ncbi:MAG: hypothetical protein AAGF12_38055 [Myxococcota bacterium]
MRLVAALSMVAVGVGGCFMNHGDREIVEPPTWTADISISAVSLGEDCGSHAGDAPNGAPPQDGDGRFGDCALPPGEPDEAPGLIGGCGFPCQESSMALAIDADGDIPLAFQVRRVTVIDSDTREALFNLTPTRPQVFQNDSYVEWDETIPTPSELRTLYRLDGIDWSSVERSYQRMYRLEVEVEIQGETRTLTSEETAREAPIVT